MADLVMSEYHGHKIVPWAVEEECFFCHYPASHKVGEEDVYDTHNLTAYVCCNHFWSTCENTGSNDIDTSEHTIGCQDWMSAAPGQRKCVCSPDARGYGY